MEDKRELFYLSLENEQLKEKLVELSSAMVKAITDDSVEGLKNLKPYWRD